MRRSIQQAVLFCWLVLMSMFVLKLWYTVLWVILFAIIMTFTQKKRTYCSNVCPIGYFQDRAYRSKEGKKQFDPSLLKKVIFILFWSYLIISIALLHDQADLLWFNMLLIMLFSLLTALFLQHFYRKRFWCSYVCPVGSLLKSVIKITR